MNLMNAMQNTLKAEKTLTTNGAVAYRTSGHELTDFNYQLSAMRGMSESDIGDMFASVYFENKELAVKYIFYLGDIRGGAGERKTFRACLKRLINLNAEIAIKVMALVPEYNRWDSVIEVYFENENTEKAAVELINKQLKEDLLNCAKGKSVSLCAKWMPSINTSSVETVRKAKRLAKALGVTEKVYRKMLSTLRKHLQVTEVNMSANDWGNINYEAVPSKANLQYNNAFLKHDEDRRRDFLNALTKGEVKVNAGALQPHEIVKKYIDARGWYNSSPKVDANLEGAWKNLPNIATGNTLIVRDGSGSMNWGDSKSVTPMIVGDALSIYAAQHNTGIWKDKFITFSSRPQLVDITNAETLRDALDILHKYTECSNTDVYKTMRLILDTAVKNHLSQADMPEMILIISDMQFDGLYMGWDNSLFDEIADEFAYAGYQLPRICFWNVNGILSKTVPMQENGNGLILTSGFSVEIMKMFMSNKTDPYEILLDTLNSSRYDAVAQAIAS